MVRLPEVGCRSALAASLIIPLKRLRGTLPVIRHYRQQPGSWSANEWFLRSSRFSTR